MAPSVIGFENIDNAYREFVKGPGAFETKSAAFGSLKLRRDMAAHVWRSRGLPTRKEEKWQYTDLSVLKNTPWAAAEPLDRESLPPRSQFPRIEEESCVEIVLLNGRLVPDWSTLTCEGIRVWSAAAESSKADSPELARHRQALENSFTFTKDSEIFDAVNASFSNDVVFIEVDAGAVFKSPIIVSSFSATPDSLSEVSVVAPRLVVRMGVRSEASLIEMTSGTGRYFTAPVTQIQLARSARLSHVRLNLEPDSTVHVGSVKIEQSSDSFCETFQFTLGGHLVRENLEIQLKDRGAEAVLDGLYMVDGKRHVDHSTSVEHIAPQTTSSQLYKGVLTDESRAVFNGRVHIHRDAQQSNAAQMNNNLMLSAKAEVDTKPELEIDADDVKASHGATIGQIDPEHVFYLQARAISKEQATSMLSRGFAADVAFRISNVNLRTIVTGIVEKHLNAKLKGSI